MGKRFTISRWLVLALVIATLAAPIAGPGLLGGGSSQPAALAQNDQTGQDANTGDTGASAIPTETAIPQTNDDSTDAGTEGDSSSGDIGDPDTSAAQPPTETPVPDNTDSGGDGDTAPDNSEVTSTIEPTSTETPLPTVDDLVSAAALPNNAVSTSCTIPDVRKPKEALVQLWVDPVDGYGAPSVKIVLLQDYQNQDVAIDSGTPSFTPNPLVGTGAWQWGPATGAFHIKAEVTYTPTAGGTPETVTVESQCDYIPLPPTATATNVPSIDVTLTTAMFNAAGNVSIPHNSTVPMATGSNNVYDTVTILNGGTPVTDAKGSVTYTFYSDASCSTSAGSDTKNLSGGVAPKSKNFPIAANTTYNFTVSYSGDDKYKSATSGCNTESFTTGAAAPTPVPPTPTTPGTIGVTLKTVMHSNPGGAEVPNGAVLSLLSVSQVNDTATIWDATGTTQIIDATGTLSYRLYATADCSDSGTASNRNVGQTSGNFNLAPNKSYNFRVTYSGNGKYAGTTSACNTEYFSTSAETPPTNTPQPTATRTNSGTPNGSIEIRCGNSTIPAGMALSGYISLSGEGYAIVNYTLEKRDGTSEIGGPIRVDSPQTNNQVFSKNGVYTKAYMNAVFYDKDDKQYAVANATSNCKTNTLVNLVAPGIGGNECTGGVFTPPSVIVPASTDELKYTVDQQPSEANGWTYKVTATILDTDLSWGATTGWTVVDATTATFTGAVAPKPCTPIKPVAPKATDGSCLGGVWTAPSVEAVQGAGYTAAVTQQPNAGNGWTYIVTATIKDAYSWDDLAGTGWAKLDDSTATYTSTVKENPCKEAKPAAPKAADGVCTGGVWTAPSVEAVQGDGYSAQVTQTPNAGNNWTYIVTATIEDGYTWNLGAGWHKVSDSVATYTSTVKENPCTETTPVAPEVTPNNCVGGKPVASTITPVTTPGLNYVVTQQPTSGNGWTYKVTATVKNGYAWGDLTGTGWVKLNDTTATFSDVAPPKPCIETIPAKPKATDGVCTGGAWTAPSVEAVQGEGYTAAVTQTPNAGNGWTYIVTATIADGHSWDDLTGSGWVRASNSTATYTSTVKENPCTETLPAAPKATDGVCTGGAWTAPSVEAVQGAGYTAAVTQQPNAGNNWTYIVTATIQDTYAWGNLTDTGWHKVSDSVATFTKTVEPNLCTPVEPTAPKATDGVCTGGAWTAPSVEAVQGAGYTAEVTQTPNAGNNWTYIVTATIQNTYAWDDLDGTGWHKVSDSVATFTKTVEPNLCTPIKPVAPKATDGVCTGGMWTAPSVEAVQGIGYTAQVTQMPNAGNAWTYVVTATIQDTYAWDDLTGTGWEKSSNSVATYTSTVVPNLCKDVLPVAPKVTGNECKGGVFTPPTVVPVETEGMTYQVTQQPTEANGWKYIVTATVTDGHAWGDLTGSGWEKTSNSVATYNGTVVPKLCTPIEPVAPKATDGSCLGGVYTPPSVTPIQGAGYTAQVTQQPNPGNHWTYIVTATIQDTYAWDDLANTGWHKVSDSVATYTGAVVPNLCKEVTPVAPKVTGNECVDGVYVPPTVVPGQTKGVVYTVIQHPSAKNRWTYTVKATIVGEGIVWGDLSGTNWDIESPTVATFTSTVVLKGCDLPKPHGPHGVQVLPSTGAGPGSDSTLTLLGLLAMAAASATAAGLILRRKPE